MTYGLAYDLAYDMWQDAILEPTYKIIKEKLLRTCIFPVATYSCHTWTISQILR